MKINLIETKFNIYIELSGSLIGYLTNRYNNKYFCIFLDSHPITLEELGQIYDKMEELNGT